MLSVIRHSTILDKSKQKNIIFRRLFKFIGNNIYQTIIIHYRRKDFCHAVSLCTVLFARSRLMPLLPFRPG